MRTGARHTDEARQKMKKAARNRLPVSEETRRKAGVSLSKPVLQYDLQHNLLRQWGSATEAGKELGLVRTSITMCCRGKLKTSGGFIWEYTDKEK